MQRYIKIFSILFVGLNAGCVATETHKTLTVDTVATYGTPYNGEKQVLVVGNFQNRSNYLQGIFSGNVDKLGNQAKTILKTHLQQTNRFTIVDRENMSRLQKEAEISQLTQKLTGARYVITGDVTEFGRKNTGDEQLFGILGKAKTQTAYAKVSINIVDTKTSEIVFSTQSAGEYALSNREIIGFGSTASYDATLNGKVLNLALTNAVNNIVEGIETDVWNIRAE